MKAKPQKGRKAYMHAYHQRPEVKERKRAYYQRPEVKEHVREYKRAYDQRPGVKERKKADYREKHTIPDAMLSPRVKRLLALAEGWT